MNKIDIEGGVVATVITGFTSAIIYVMKLYLDLCV